MSKKAVIAVLAVVLCIAAGLAICFFALNDSDATEGFIYNLSDDEKAYIVSGVGERSKDEKEMTVPSQHEGKPVIAIGDKAFKGCDKLERVTLPNSIESIGAEAFANCSALSSVNTPEGLVRMGRSAFIGCDALLSTRNDVIYVNNWVVDCYSEYEDRNVNSVEIEKGTVGIAEYAFVDCKHLTKVKMPDSIKYINDCAFSRCSSLTDIKIPSGVTRISEGMFDACSSLLKMAIPENIRSIGKSAFSNCNSLTEVAIPPHITAIEDGTFANCAALENIDIPKNVTAIGEGAFRGCSKLLSIELSDNIKKIGAWAFENCSALEGVYITSMEKWLSIEFSNHASNPLYIAGALYLNDEKVESLTVPEGISHISAYAFYGSTTLREITVPADVSSIGEWAFERCEALERLYIKDIGAWMNIDFENHASNPMSEASGTYFGGKLLSELVIPKSVTSVKEYSFYGCKSLKSVKFHNGVTSIADWAFDSCPQFTSVIIDDMDTWCSIVRGHSNPMRRQYDIYVNGELLSHFEIDGGREEIESYLLKNCKSVTSVTIGHNVKKIGHEAFASCENLIVINYKGSVDEWNKIEKSHLWDREMGAYIINCTDGKLTKPSGDK